MASRYIVAIWLVFGLSFCAQGETSKSEFEELKMRLIDAENKIKALENRNDQPVNIHRRFLLNGIDTPIGFTACVANADLTNLGDGQAIIFDRSITNTGGAYHNHTGIFIAPIKGLYVFHLAAMTSPGDNQYLAFVKDRTPLSYVYPDSRGTQTYQTGSGDWVLELDANSEVWVETLHAGEIHGNCFTTFSGFLLSPME